MHDLVILSIIAVLTLGSKPLRKVLGICGWKTLAAAQKTPKDIKPRDEERYETG